MDPKIDLTENRDFRKPIYDARKLVDFPTTLHFGPFSLTRLTSIFGERGHNDQRFRIFGVIGYIKRCESRCNRCGKELVIPWKRLNSGLCLKCESDLHKSFELFPWEDKLTINFNNNSSNPKDIFNMK